MPLDVVKVEVNVELKLELKLELEPELKPSELLCSELELELELEPEPEPKFELDDGLVSLLLSLPGVYRAEPVAFEEFCPAIDSEAARARSCWARA